ncbi:transglycosylase SLT domain-containing protein [Saccharopolyspora sp. MS10]|uniref:transglycosylase SLT domain-containing protein n=1 Tax=Saccharopolyspora sp. MS10 TaxID=3385973 RepID=UPI0039A08C08
MSSPDHTFPDVLSDPDRTAPGRAPAALRRLRERAVPALRELRSIGDDAAAGPHRLSPRMRRAQLGAAVLATGVLSAALGGSPAAEQVAAPGAPAAPVPAADEQVADPGLPAAEVAGQVPPGPVSPPNTGPGPGIVPADPIDGWIGQATAVLEAHGVPRDQVDPAALRTIIEHESGGDPTAANAWDSNAAAGTPSKGLMQTIDPTFESYALPGHQDIWNPVDNIVAATRYSIERYGSVSNVPGVVGVGGGGSYEGY